ncbi:hypothetical protein [Actinoplanes sp. CA-252034]|uniref:hypothetical protein n=1 Tax=Actinoplanes sp. CA-252034 TaxID=3239906 RepID=UPI003D9991FA
MSETAHYESVASPAESLNFEWDDATGTLSQFKWVHGGVPWHLHKESPGQITTENPNVNYYDVDLNVTTDQFETDPNALKGKITVNKSAPPDGAVFAGILEGTGSAWLVAKGTLTPPKV